MEILSRAQSELGHPSYYFDIAPRRRFRFKFLTLPVLAFADIIDFHYARSFLCRRDLPILNKMQKKIVFHFHGCDIRYRNDRKNFQFNACHHCYAECTASSKTRLLEYLRKYANGFVVTTPDLLKFAPEATYIPAAVRTEEFEFVPPREHSVPLRVVHAPSDPAIKGTKHIIDALKPFIEKGEVVLSLVQNASHEEAVKIYRNADIAIDQLLVGWYGLFAQEMMALGKPVICYIDRDLRRYQNALPVINADLWSLPSVIQKVITDDKLRRTMSFEGRRFVERVHSSRIVARQLIKLYGTL